MHQNPIETLITLGVLGLFFWQSAAFRDTGFARGASDRYQEAVELKVPILLGSAGTGRVVNICTHFGGWLPETERKSLADWTFLTAFFSAKTERESSADRTGACASDSRHPIAVTAMEEIDPSVVAGWAKVYQALADSLAHPLKAKLSRLAELENRARDARAETDVRGAAESLASETRAYREAYGINIGKSGSHSIPLECAWYYLEKKYHALARGKASEADRVLVLVSMAALLDGDLGRALIGAFPFTEAAGDTWTKAELDLGCATLGSPWQAIKHGADIVGKARASENNAKKSMAMLELLSNAHWYFALWVIVGLLLLQIGRRAVYAHRFVLFAVLLWAVVGWVTHVHVEWISDKSIYTAWLTESASKWTIGAAVLLMLVALLLLRRWSTSAPLPPQTPSSRIGYAGFVLFVGLGWCLLLDLSVMGHYQSRFLALYQQVYIFAAFVLLSILPTLRLGLAQVMGRWFGLFLLLTKPGNAGFRRYLPWIMYVGVAAVVLLVTSVALRNQRQLTSEIFRIWLIFGMSWFFFVRGESVLSLSSGGMKRVRHIWSLIGPLVFVACVPVAGLLLTDDHGPLLVMLYGASVFLGAGMAFAFDRVGYGPWLGDAAGIAVAGAWVYVVTHALFWLGERLTRVAERLASVRNPFVAANDQLAIITWFQESTPASGYGFGVVPWCGEIVGASCRGVPKQIQSDYIFTALVGVYGKGIAVGLVALLVFWLARVVINHRRVTRGVVTFESPVATQQAWISWIVVCWVGLTLAQLAITVAGNLGWLPLTGITFPFASFGVWSLLANTFFLSLAINVPRKT